MTEARGTLAASRLFAALPDQILGDVARLMRPVTFDADEVVFRQGWPGDEFLRVKRSDRGRRGGRRTDRAPRGRAPRRAVSAHGHGAAWRAATRRRAPLAAGAYRAG
jgi:hypothetical protein